MFILSLPLKPDTLTTCKRTHPSEQPSLLKRQGTLAVLSDQVIGESSILSPMCNTGKFIASEETCATHTTTRPSQLRRNAERMDRAVSGIGFGS
jgi:hypothetical protein